MEILLWLETGARERQRQAGGDRGNQYTGGKVAVTQKFGEAPFRHLTGYQHQKVRQLGNSNPT